MGRKKINFDKMPARFPQHTFKQIDTVLKEGETRTDFIRTAVERELENRERNLVRKEATSYNTDVADSN